MGRSIVLLSGGMDSATVLAVAREAGDDCYALSFDYGQKHNAELNASRILAEQLGAIEHRVMKIDIGQLGGSALTDMAIDVPMREAREYLLLMCPHAIPFFCPSHLRGRRYWQPTAYIQVLML